MNINTCILLYKRRKHPLELFVTRLCVCDITATHSIDLSDSVRVMTMLDQLLQILSPQKDLGASGGGCNHHSSGHSGGRKFNKKQRNWIK